MLEHLNLEWFFLNCAIKNISDYSKTHFYQFKQSNGILVLNKRNIIVTVFHFTYLLILKVFFKEKNEIYGSTFFCET